MKIAVFAPTFVPTLAGAEIALYNILNKLSEYGDVEIHLFLPYFTKRLFDKKGPKVKYRVYSLPPKFVSISFKNKRVASLYFRLYFNMFFRKLKIDIAWFHLFFPLADGISDYFLKRNIPYVIAGRGVDIQKDASVGYGYRQNPKYEKRIQEIALKATKAISISNSIQDDFLALGLSKDRTVIIPNAIDTKRYNSVKPADLRKELGIDYNLKVILTVGRYNPKKGYEYIPPIIEELLKFRDDFIWLIVGKGVEENLSLSSETFKYVKFLTQYSKPNADLYIFPGNDLIGIYKASDIFVFPTAIEGLGNVTLEAIASGLPVMVSDVPGCRDIITNSHDGILIKAGDIKKFAEEIDNLLNNEELSNKLIRNGLGTVEKYSSKNIINKYYSFFKAIVVEKMSL